jgi:hypothetical protein
LRFADRPERNPGNRGVGFLSRAREYLLREPGFPNTGDPDDGYETRATERNLYVPDLVITTNERPEAVRPGAPWDGESRPPFPWAVRRDKRRC